MTRQDISYREIEAEERRKTLIRSVFIGQNPSAEEILTLPKEWVEKMYWPILQYGPQAQEIRAMQTVFKNAVDAGALEDILQWGLNLRSQLTEHGVSPEQWIGDFMHPTDLEVWNFVQTYTDWYSRGVPRLSIKTTLEQYSQRFETYLNGYSVHVAGGEWFSIATQALSLRDFIEDPDYPNFFSQEDYDQLTCVWRFFFGKIHADDEPVKTFEQMHKMLGVTQYFVIGSQL